MYRITTLVTGFFLAASFAFAQEATFEVLGVPPGDGNHTPVAHAVSADGRVVVGHYNSGQAGVSHVAFRWEDGEMEILGHLPGGASTNTSQATATSADGSVVVGVSSSDEGLQAFRWENETMTGLGDLPGELFGSQADAVSADGSVIVGRGSSIDGNEAFRWEDGEMVGLGHLSDYQGFLSSRAIGVSPDGTVVVGQSSSENWFYEAFRWEDGEMVGLGDLPGSDFSSTALAVSANGSVIVGHSSSDMSGPQPQREPFRWEDGDMEGLGTLSDIVYSEASGVSADGSIVVGGVHSPRNIQGAFIWTQEEGLRNLKDVLENDYGLDLTGWILEIANDISADGTVIVGRGINPDGDTEAWRAVIPHTIADEATPEALADVLSPPSPNPASGTSTFTIAVEQGQHVAVEVFDVMGRRVQTVYEGTLAARMSETLTLDARALPAGVYIVRSTGEDFSRTRRVTVLR